MANELFPIELKAVGDQGEIEGYASNFGNRDLAGDIVQRGAFARSLASPHHGQPGPRQEDPVAG